MKFAVASRAATFSASAISLLLSASCQRGTGEPSADEEARRIYGMVCARCHGADGKGAPAGFSGSTPTNLTDPAFHRARTDADIERVLTQGKGAMPAFGKMYRPEDIAALVRVVRGLNAEKK